MRFHRHLPLQLLTAGLALHLGLSTAQARDQVPVLQHGSTGRHVSVALFAELEELARIVDISYCVGLTSFGIIKPFRCLSRCADFPQFELVTTWNTGPLLSDSSGYIALDHGKGRIIVAFRGTYSIANTVVDLSTIPQEYVPYPGSDDDNHEGPNSVIHDFLDGITGKPTSNTENDHAPKCSNCTVHMGFNTSWRITRSRILDHIQRQVYLYPDYKVHLVGHSLGGAVAALAGLDMLARGWNPAVTTFGEPRVGNHELVRYIDERFNLVHRDHTTKVHAEELKYRRVTHVDDPVPLLPLGKWGYAMHAGEIFISKPSLSPDVQDVDHCRGDNDPACIAGHDAAILEQASDTPIRHSSMEKRDLLKSIEEEVQDVINEPWGIPSRYKLWQLFFAHRDHFWRLGLCVPGGDSTGGGGIYERPFVEI